MIYFCRRQTVTILWGTVVRRIELQIVNTTLCQRQQSVLYHEGYRDCGCRLWTGWNYASMSAAP